MANLKKYTTNVIGSAEALNTCPRIVVYLETPNLPAISLFRMGDITSEFLKTRKNCLIIPRTESGKYEYRKDDLDWLTGDDEKETYEKRLDWGFDVILYLSASGTPLGYTKFSEPNGKGRTNLDIVLNFSVSIDSSSGEEIELNTSISSISQTDEYKISGYPRLKDLSEMQTPGPSRYNCHLSGEDIDFLGSRSVIDSSQPLCLDFLYSEVINPYTKWSEFTSHQVSYYGGSDIVLESWTPTHYSIVSLLKSRRDIFNHPFVYAVTKEGRRPIPKYNNHDTTILYLSGKYAICDVSDTTKIYDTSRDMWLETRGWVISNPLRPDNKIVDLVSPQVPYDQLAEYVPEINNLFLDLSSDIIKIYRVVGNWVIIEKETTSTLKSYRVCGPMIALDVLKSELPFLTFLNDSTLLYYDKEYSRCYIYHGRGKEFVSPRYKLNYQKLGLSSEPIETGEEVSMTNITGSSLDLFRRKQPHPELPNIISGFAGLVFYVDDKNRIYYL